VHSFPGILEKTSGKDDGGLFEQATIQFLEWYRVLVFDGHRKIER
jgi:hypothetical protein